ncbi:MAG: Eco47II family restriction endonuclease [Pseudanabaena sp.]|jgi:hypothetical protein|nr:Eco47II family restriction endonuclease [Pseudanabaena sp. M051S1SP1A06QC]MCE2978119.1 Eco47II family restriction endonuclease [Pseudanabaena sp. CoA8_M7]
MRDYNLDFISNENLYNHVKETVNKYRFKVDLSEFNKNLIDPIKLTFDSKVYGKNINDVIENEVIRQVDKSNTNQIGYFHQNIFRYIGSENGWYLPESGYDISNDQLSYYVEMKNKHNTMNSKSSAETYEMMQKTIRTNPNAICLLVEVIAKKSQNIAWHIKLGGISVSDQRIRQMSIDRFYELVTGDQTAFKKLCEKLPSVIDDIVSSGDFEQESNSVIQELNAIDNNLLKSLFLLSFKKYAGFDNFNV